ncbi:MAG: hypothetical protein IKW74_06505, partial [Thermoguttaceae bacterium]|nr:hypothetical protein [Thermoguttaceae bacterium]
QMEGSICTGSVFWHEGTFYAFYANRCVRAIAPDGKEYAPYYYVALSTSPDGIHFTKQEPSPLFHIPIGDYRNSFRDPTVFQDERDGLFHMFVTSTYKNKGCWVHAISRDLRHWELTDPLFTQINGEPECPNVFKWGNYYYLIANHLNGYYRMSDSPTGPWETPNCPNILMPGIVNVPKTAPFKDNRCIICAWSREHGFGGHAVFHELVQHADGTLGEKFVPEMIPKTGDPIVTESDIERPETTLEQLPAEFRLQMELAFDPQKRDSLYDLQLEGNEEVKILVSPGERAVYLNQFKLEKVCFSTSPMKLDVIIKGNLIDLCVNDDRAVIDTLKQPPTRTFTLKKPEGIQVKSVTICPLM